MRPAIRGMKLGVFVNVLLPRRDTMTPGTLIKENIYLGIAYSFRNLVIIIMAGRHSA